MPKVKTSLFAIVAGVAAGAAAFFLSDPNNRTKTKKVLSSAAKQAQRLEKEYQANPEAFKKKIKNQAQKTAKSALKKASAAGKKVVKNAQNSSKKSKPRKK